MTNIEQLTFVTNPRFTQNLMIFFSVKFSWAQPSWNSDVVENARGVTNLSNHVVETARKKHIVNKAGREIL